MKAAGWIWLAIGISPLILGGIWAFHLPWFLLTAAGMVPGILGLALLFGPGRPTLFIPHRRLRVLTLLGWFWVCDSLFGVTSAPFPIRDPWIVLASLIILVLALIAAYELPIPRGTA